MILVLHAMLPAVETNACWVLRVCRVSFTSIMFLLPSIPIDYCKLRTLAKHRQRYSLSPGTEYAQYTVAVHYPEHGYPQLLPLFDSLVMPLANTPVACPLCFKCVVRMPK